MAYKNIVITPANVQNYTSVKTSQFYKGFSTIDETSTNVKLYDHELIKQDLLNQFNTRKGERVMNPSFGSIIWDLIYEPLTPEVKQLISMDIDRILASDPRVTPSLVNIVEQDYGFLLELTLSYNGIDVSDSMVLSFDKRVGLAG
jgi:phage baseplate assembly protein W